MTRVDEVMLDWVPADWRDQQISIDRHMSACLSVCQSACLSVCVCVDCRLMTGKTIRIDSPGRMESIYVSESKLQFIDSEICAQMIASNKSAITTEN